MRATSSLNSSCKWRVAFYADAYEDTNSKTTSNKFNNENVSVGVATALSSSANAKKKNKLAGSSIKRKTHDLKQIA